MVFGHGNLLLSLRQGAVTLQETLHQEDMHMESITASEPFKRVIRKHLGAGLSKLKGRAFGGGLWGFAVPVALFVIEDITRPDGVVIPLCKWVLAKTARVRVVEVSPQPFRKNPEKPNV